MPIIKSYLQYVQEFHEANQLEVSFLENQLQKHLQENIENQTEIETILDFLYSNQNIDISKIGYKTILEKTEKWHKKLQSVSSRDNEAEGVDYETVLDFKDGFKFVKLISKPCYEREGKLMSHCVASYFGRNTTIYSLRDSKNKPHCTIEDGQQVKGKGNGKIDPKYIEYVVKFLEFKGMIVGKNEMKNLGYVNLNKISSGLTCDSLYNGYIHTDKIDTIKDSEGRQYKGMGLFEVKPVCEIEEDGKFSLFEDIRGVVEYETLIHSKGGNQNALSGNSNQNASSGNYNQNASSGDYNQNASSGDYNQNALSGNSNRNASSGDYTRNALSGDFTRNASSGNYNQNASSGDYNQNASSGDYNQNALSGNSNRNASSGDFTRNASSGDFTRNASSGNYNQNALSGNSNRNASSGYSTRNALSGNYNQNASSGDYTQSEINGKYGITADIGINSRSKGIIGTWIVLAEYNKNSEGFMYPKLVKCGQIDGNILKENTWYFLKNGEFTEV